MFGWFKNKTQVVQAPIKSVGSLIVDERNRKVVLVDWEFDKTVKVPETSFRNGKRVFKGYNLDELKEIITRPSEFEIYEDTTEF